MSEPNEAVERLKTAEPRYWAKDGHALSAPSYNPTDVNILLDEREILLRKAAAFDAMVEHGWRVQINNNCKYSVFRENPDEPGDIWTSEGATALEAVEHAVKGLEGR